MATLRPERRKEQAKRKENLDASAVPIEQALLFRAEALDARALTQRVDEIPWHQVADEFRALAEELHYW